MSSLTLSEAKDNAALALDNQNGNFPGPQDLKNRDADFGLSGYHQPYNSTTSFVWSLPFGKGKRWGNDWSGVVDLLLGGWQLSGVNTMAPGEAVTFTYSPASSFQVSSITNDFSGANNYRPNVIACVTVPTDPSKPFGDAKRNSVRGPNFRQFDAALIKQVFLPGQARVELRLEAFNLFNRVNYGPPNGNRSSAAFGTITSTYEARQLQLGAKFIW